MDEKKEYIERGELIRELHECGIFPVIVRRTIERAPAADVVEVVHGEWIVRFDGRYNQRRTYCSVCDNHSGVGGNKQEPPYCPNCGAKMDGGKRGQT